MAIEAGKTYHLIYAALAFAKNEPFLRKIKTQYNIEIPFIDHEFLSPDLREALDTYIYIPASDENWKSTLQKLNRSYSQVPFTYLGPVPGKDILKLIESCEQTVRHTITKGEFYRVLQGPLRNLQVKLEDFEGDTATVSYELLGETRTTSMSLSSLELIEHPLNPWAGFRNLMTTEFNFGNKNAVIVDGSFALHRAMYGHDRTYTKAGRFVGGCHGFYFDLLRLKELYPEREVHVVFDGYDERKFADNPEYKATRMQASSKFQTAYVDNQNWCEQLTKALGFHLHVPPASEGDDIIGSLAHQLTKNLGYNKVCIYSTDTDFYQLVDDQITLYIPKVSFRGHSSHITPDLACQEFGVNRNDKINWYRALTGDTSDNIPSVNKFYQDLTGVSTKYKGAHYTPIINAAETFEQCKADLKADSRFFDFVDSGKYEENYNLLQIKRDLFKDATDFDQLRQEFDEDKFISLLEECAFFKEIEQAPRVIRILKGVW